MLCIGKAHAEIISIHASVRKRPSAEYICMLSIVNFNPRFREEATSRHGERMSAFLCKQLRGAARLHGTRGSGLGKSKFLEAFLLFWSANRMGGTMSAYGSHRGCGVSMGRLSRGSLLCYSGRLELRGGTNEGSGLECFGVFFGGRRRTRVRGGIGGRGDLFAVKQKGF